MQEVKLSDWTEFESKLAKTLMDLGHQGLVLVRNFAKVTFNDMEEVDRLEIVLRTGTDRDATSDFWNAEGHDHDHDTTPMGKSPNEIIYAYTVDWTKSPYQVHYLRERSPEVMDLTEGIDENVGIIIYDASKLRRVSKNEYWFLSPPLDAALFVMTLKSTSELLD